MRYIKTYDSLNEYNNIPDLTLDDRLKYDDIRDSFYWQVNTKQPYFSIALKKIGMPEGERKYYIDMFEDEDNPDFEVFIFKTHNEEDECDDWSYASLNFKEPSYRKPSVFMGKVDVADWEVEAEKYNL